MEEDKDIEENEDLQKEFEALVESVHKEINVHIANSCRELEKACTLADKHGVSFRSSISFLSQPYIVKPNEKFSKLDTSFVSEVTETWSEYGEEGWQHSAVC